uniref:DNA-directed RNA polymerase n=1 Tax=Pteridomonas sp. YPF1301 TaxID=2766739 RepID=A0A7G1MPM0_9STRA|nr:RNA polymerase b''-subunit [Pteridomonas sp. YPF1301]
MIKIINFQNRTFKKTSVKNFIYSAYTNYNKTQNLHLLNELKNLGFFYATKSGLSLGISDFKIPVIKKQLIIKSYSISFNANIAFLNGTITFVERFQQIFDIWSKTNFILINSIINYLTKVDPFNSLRLMVFSGARGNIDQLRQLIGIRGLMADSNGQLIDIPIIHNFKEGLTLTDYLIASFGARKGVVDTALKTAEAGYLTRRLITTTTDMIIRDNDCFTTFFLRIYKTKNKTTFLKQIIGRISAETIYDFIRKVYIIYINTQITENIALLLFKMNKPYICVYSILTCLLDHSICKKCYGWDISRQKGIKLGESIGVIAAQSIGEPAIQLTMRTFHTGGSFTLNRSRQIRINNNGLIFYKQIKNSVTVRTNSGILAQFVKTKLNIQLITYRNFTINFLLPPNIYLYIKSTSFISKNSLLAEIIDLKKEKNLKSYKHLIAPHSGEIFLLAINETLCILKGKVYDLPFRTFINFSLISNFNYNLKFIFYSKICVLINGFLIKKIPFIKKLTDFFIIQTIHIFLFPLFWDTKIQKVFLLDSFNMLFSLEALPCIINKKFLLFGTKITGFYQLENLGQFLLLTSSFLNFNKIFFYQTIIKNTKLFYIPCEFFSTSIPENSFFINENTYLKNLNLEIFSGYFSKNRGFFQKYIINDFFTRGTIKPCLYFKYNNLSYQESVNFSNIQNQLRFSGEIIGEHQIISFLCLIELIKINRLHHILLRPIYDVNIPKNRQTIFFKNSSFLLKTLTFFNTNRHYFNIFMHPQNLNFIHSNLLIQNKISLNIKSTTFFFKIYFYNKLPYLMFLGALNFGLTFLNLYNKNTEILKILPQIKNLEYVRMNSIIGLSSFFIKNEPSIKKIRIVLIQKPRILYIKNNHLYRYFFEQSKRYNNFGKIITKQNYFLSFIKSSKMGKILSNTSFSTLLHQGTPFFITSNIRLYYYPKNLIKKDDIFGIIMFDQTISGDIIKGLPKIEEILEIQTISNLAVLAKTKGILQYPKKIKNNQNIKIQTFTVLKDSAINNYFLKQKTNSNNYIRLNFSFIMVGQTLTSGEVNIKDLLNIIFVYFLQNITLYSSVYSTFKRLQILLTKQILEIYLIQKIYIVSKHIEILLFQLTSKIKIICDDSNTFIIGEIVDLSNIFTIMQIYHTNLKTRLYYKPYIVGISSFSKYERSFISAASFQNTTMILSRAAIEGRLDWLHGLKENVITGRCISFGTRLNDF